MPLTNPPTAKALGQRTVVILDPADVAATTGIPTLAEVNGGLFASLHFYGSLRPVPTQNTGEGPRKMGSKVSPTRLGLVNFPAVDAQFSYLPQKVGTAGAPGNEVYEAFVPGTQAIVVILDGKDGEDTDALAANDVGDIFLYDIGARRKGETGDGEFDELACTVSLVPAGGEPIAEDHKFTA